VTIKSSLRQSPGTQPEGTKHGTCFCCQGTNLSFEQEVNAKTVTNLLILLSVLYVALFILLIGISIFNLSAGVVPKPQVLFIF